MSDLYRKTLISIEKNKNNIDKLILIYRDIILNRDFNNISRDKKYYLLQKCINYDVNVNLIIYNGNTILHTMCIDCNLNFIKTLVYNGANVNQRDDMGNTPMHLLVSYMDNKKSRFQIANFLFRNGVDISIINNRGIDVFSIDHKIYYKYKEYILLKKNFIKKIKQIHDNYLKIKKRIYEFAQLTCFDTNKSEFSKFFKLECGIRKFFVKRINTYL